MATITWTGAAGDGNFNNPANWSPAQVPGSADSVTISPTAALVLNVPVTLANLTTDAHVTLTVGDYQTLQIGDSAATAKLVNGGTITLYNGHDAGLVLDATTTTLGGGGTIEDTDRVIQASAAGQALDNVNNTIAGSGDLGYGTLTFVNAAAGIVDANQSGATLDINTGTVATTNAGVLEATGGGNLQIDSSVSNGSTGAIDANGGNVTFTGGTISTGTLTASNGGTFYDNGSATLNGGTAGLVIDGNLVVTDGSQLSLLGSISNAGTLSESYVHGAGILVGPATGGTATLAGGGTITLTSGLQAGGTGDHLVNVNNTIDGYSSLGDGSNLAIVNQAGGVIDATGGLTLNTGTATTVNSGLIEATTGALSIDSAISNTGTGYITAAVGNVYLQDGSSVVGGTLSTSGGGQVVVTSGSTLSVLNNVTNAGTLDIADYSTAILLGTLTNTGTLYESYVHSTGLLIGPTSGAVGTVTLTGSGTVTLASSLQASQSGETLINVNNVIDGYDELGAGSNLAIVNDAAGVIDATGGLTLSTGTATTVNHGLIEATTGILYINSAISNAGAHIAAAGGNVILQDGSSIAGGTLSSSGGAEIVITSGSTLSVLNGTAGLTNTGTILVADYSTAILLGTITNTGTIMEAYVHGTGLLVGPTTGAVGTVTLTGGGTVTLASNLQASQSGEKLVNVNNTINGYDQLGNGTNLAIVNGAAGTIDATGGLVVNTGTIAVQNSGLMEATATATTTGALYIDTTVNNGASGQIDAAGANVLLEDTGVIEGGTLTSSNGGRIIVTSLANNTLGIIDGTAHAITNDAYIEVTDYSGLLIEGTFINNGTLHNDYVHGAGIVIASNTVFTNNGTLQANQLDTNFGAGTKLTNDVNGTLTGGTYQAIDANLIFSTAVVTTLGSGTLLDENHGEILFGGHDISASLKYIDAGATLIIENGSLIGSQALSNKGTLQLNGATYGVGTLSNAAGAAITGNGDIGASLNSLGLIDATTGELDLTGKANSLGGTIAGGAGDFVGIGGATTLDASAVVTATDLEVLYNSSLHLASKLSYGGTLQLNGLVNVSGGALTLSGFLEQRSDGSGQGTISAALTSSGTIQIDQGGTLSATGGITNTGLILDNGGLIDPHALTGGTLSIGQYGSATLATAAAANSTLAVLDMAGGALTTNGTLTVTGDYDNTASGTGNSYNPFAGVTGIIDGRGTKLSVVGVDGTKITSVNGTETITIAAGGTAYFEIKNGGTATASMLRGALETTINGGSITGTALTGSGVTAANFGPIAGGGTSDIFAITYSGGGLSGEAIHIASDFANVAGITLDIVAQAAAPAATLSVAPPDYGVSTSDWALVGRHG